MPCALLKVFCSCSPMELYNVYLEILFFRGIVVVVALCKILSSKAGDEEKESG